MGAQPLDIAKTSTITGCQHRLDFISSLIPFTYAAPYGRAQLVQYRILHNGIFDCPAYCWPMANKVSDPELKKLLKLLREVRHEAELTQTQLAEQLGTKQNMISKWELGERRLDVLDLRRYCRACGISHPKFAERLDLAIRGS